jgi:hypothetical protein
MGSDIIQSIANYLFVLEFIAAVLLWRAGQRFRLLGAGFFLSSLSGAIWRVLIEGERYDFTRALCRAVFGGGGMPEWTARYSRISPLLWGTGTILILFGAVFLFRGRRVPPLAGASTAPTSELESLVIGRNESNSYSRAGQLRNELYERMAGRWSQPGVNMVGYKSPENAPDIWVHFEFDVPQSTQNLSLRGSVRVTIERFDYHSYEHLHKIELRTGVETCVVSGVIELRDMDLDNIRQYLTAETVRRVPRFSQVRQFGWDLWRPSNKVTCFSRNWAITGFSLAAVLLICLPVWIPLGQLLGVAIVVGLVIYKSRRKTYVFTTGRPLQDPRTLLRLDSWQASIKNLGPKAAEFKQSLLGRLTAAPDPLFAVVPERIWHHGVDGKVEREQIVLRYRRAIGFVHIVAHGDDLYVGWDTHVNAGTWTEQTMARGMERESRKNAVANRVVAAVMIPNEYDLMDANFLTEQLHLTLSSLLRLKMEENKIDQEVDFTVQRESRRSVLTGDEKRGEEEGASPRGRLASSRLKRVS